MTATSISEEIHRFWDDDAVGQVAHARLHAGSPVIGQPEVVPRAGNPNLARMKMMRPRRIYVSADLERLFADYLTHLAGRAATTAVSWRRLSLYPPSAA